MTAERHTNDAKSAVPENGKRRRRRRPPAPVILRLCADLEPNSRHPLAELDSATRESARQRLLASILARMALSPIHKRSPAVTIPGESVPDTTSDPLTPE
jgi:hypothetical protein